MLLRYALVLTLLCGAATAVSAQESVVSPNPKKEARRSLRDARKYPAAEDLRESHLAVTKQDLRPGESGRLRNPKDGSERYKFDNTGTPRVSDQRQRVGLGLSKPKRKIKATE
ncbi:hypothetical protein [Solirubrum puertoriconensis]|uniref:Uncharacterized protein n=1 Tax=Solirubrum puertoriconensis TaxID=1751427 RepID=A0A9X0HL37_SOLP1|nr:hypothetical protein [Solirubrum puertoriconensis]KUG07987.1 hypothetical protein ASU33_07200 [Solirubrum puertoriconensis]